MEDDDIADSTIAETEEQTRNGQVAKAATEEEKQEVRLEVLRHSWGRYIAQFSTDDSIPEPEKIKRAEEKFRKWLKKAGRRWCSGTKLATEFSAYF